MRSAQRGDELEQVRDKIRLALRDGEPSIERVAALMHVTTRSLQRRLAERDTSFRAVTDEVRQRWTGETPGAARRR